MLTKFVPYLRLAPYAGIALFALLAAVQYGNARHWEKRYIASEKTVAQYEAAQVAATEINKAKVAQIEREYAAIAEESEIDYEKRIADNRAALDRWMRNQAAKRNTQSTGASEAASVPGEVVSGTETAIVPVSDLEIVADAYAQFDALRAWALEVGKVK
jgi:predicted membrane-bound mannosyltransferase